MGSRPMEMWLMAAAAAALFSLHGCSSRPAHAPEPPVLPKPPAEASAPASRPDQARPYRALGQWYQPILDPRGFRQQGTASWYGTDFHGKRASSGEVYNMHDMTAAHKTLPMGTLVRVRNLDNSRTVEVRINDRGPFVRDRIIDLSHEAARRIGMIGPGTAPVEIVAIGIVEGSPTDLYSGNFTFQIGAFTNRENAERLRAQLDSRYGNAHIQEFNRGDRMFYRLRVGRAGSLDEAIATEATLMRDGFSEVFTVAE